MGVAKKQGLACVAIKSSNHFGAASYYCQLAGEENLITFACTNSPPAIAPWGGTEPFFGTNPIAFGFPSKEGPPVIVDMSTSVVARGKIMLAAKNGELIPDGWALDRFGNMTNDPKEALQGTLLPVGGAKGAALALTVEILAGVLTGAAISRDVKSIYNEQLSGGAGVGHFFIFISTETYNYAHSYEKKLKHMLQLMKDVPGHNNREVRYPGERRQSDSEKHLQKGIDLPDSVFKELTLLGNQLGVTFPQKTADGWLINPEFEIKGSGKNPT
jgi:LDH2 family malate/lactate/ureidoglycolate dehydrogenase